MSDARVILQRASTQYDYEQSAYLLSHNEPWVSLGRTYDYSLAKVHDVMSELYVARIGNEVQAVS